jgi:glycosyltransferase involved in cell wall biosynthesis
MGTLRRSIESILAQTWSDLEFLIINDGSADNSREIISSFSDPRIRLVDNFTNIGLTKSLNRGLELAQGELIARQDADDISMPNRLEFQVSYLREHPEIVLLGTWGQVIDDEGNALSKIRPPLNPYLLKWRMLFTNHMIHSSVMFHAKEIRNLGGYNKEIAKAQDYELWNRVMRTYHVAQLPEILVYLRKHPESISANSFNDQVDSVSRVAWRNIQYLLDREVSLQEIKDIGILLRYGSIPSSSRLKRVAIVMRSVYLEVIKQWKPPLHGVVRITKDYARMIGYFASVHANIQRQGTIGILKKALIADKSALFTYTTIICVLKLILGPNLVSKTRKAMGRVSLEKFGTL